MGAHSYISIDKSENGPTASYNSKFQEDTNQIEFKMQLVQS